MSGFKSYGNEDFDRIFMTTSDLIDKYVQGGLWLCGSNNYGQLGDSTISHRSSLVQTISGNATTWVQVASGDFHTVALKSDSSLWLWGYNSSGQLGNSSTTNRSSPTQVYGGSTGWRQITAGQQNTMGIKVDGTLWGWGFNGSGQLGDSSSTNRSSPVQIYGGGNTWKFVFTGFAHSAATKTDGTLWLWGNNAYGQLGDSTLTNRSSPVQTITGGTNWKYVSAGANSTAAIKADNTLWSWGYNAYGQLGDNTITYRSSPVQTIAGGTNWRQVSCGYRFVLAIKTDGTLWSWGINSTGQLGDSTTTYRSSPVQIVGGGNNWKYTCGSAFSSSAIKTDGTLWTWGGNTNGVLGDSSTTSRSAPVQIGTNTIWKAVGTASCDSNGTVAIQYS